MKLVGCALRTHIDDTDALRALRAHYTLMKIYAVSQRDTDYATELLKLDDHGRKNSNISIAMPVVSKRPRKTSEPF